MPSKSRRSNSFGITELVFVGDRGMVKAKGKRALTTAGFRYITALTTPQVRRLLQTQVLRTEWFTPSVQEAHTALCGYLRQSEALRQQAARRRADKWAKLQRLITARNTFVQTSKRAKPEPGLRTLQAWVKRHKLEAFVQVALHDGRLQATLDTAAQAEATVLDGCYVWRPTSRRRRSLPKPSMTAIAIFMKSSRTSAR